MRNELLKGLTEEQKKKVAECNNAEEILALAKAEGVALNDEQLEAVSGGCGSHKKRCVWCGDYRWVEKVEETKEYTLYKCTFCEQYWKED